MKCPKCHNDMLRKRAEGNIWYFECPKCGKTIGKPEPPKESEEDE